jgi:hypothetical protein
VEEAMNLGKVIARYVVNKENPVLSYRFWTISDGRLVSPFWFTLTGLVKWPQTLISEKSGCDHLDCPSMECECGIYSLKNQETVYEYIRNWNSYAIGSVHIFGITIEHQNGYRSQFAKPVEVKVRLHPLDDQTVLENLKRNYKDTMFEVVDC